jgi:hypothetical protein
MSRPIAVLSLLVVLGAEASAQQGEKRVNPGAIIEPGPGTVTYPKQTFVGHWVGHMKLDRDKNPVAIDLEFTQDNHASVSFKDNAKREHSPTTFRDGALRWEAASTDGSVWVYEARQVAGDTVRGLIRLRGAGDSSEKGILFLVRGRR